MHREETYRFFFAQTPDASFCLGNHTGHVSATFATICNVINVCMLMVYLGLMRRRADDQVCLASHESHPGFIRHVLGCMHGSVWQVNEVDRQVWTAADYSVLIDGLEIDTESEDKVQSVPPHLTQPRPAPPHLT